MRTIMLFLCFLIFFSMGQERARAQEPVICDPLQTIVVKVEVVIEDPILMDLQTRGIQELYLTPAEDFCWEKAFPVENGATLTLMDMADPLSLDMQDGLIVSYKTCDANIIYAYCQMPSECLKGAYPQNVRLRLNPALKQCKIEVLCTQCP